LVGFGEQVVDVGVTSEIGAYAIGVDADRARLFDQQIIVDDTRFFPKRPGDRFDRGSSPGPTWSANSIRYLQIRWRRWRQEGRDPNISYA